MPRRTASPVPETPAPSTNQPRKPRRAPSVDGTSLPRRTKSSTAANDASTEVRRHHAVKTNLPTALADNVDKSVAKPPKVRRTRKTPSSSPAETVRFTAPAKPRRKHVSNLKLSMHTAPDAVVEPLLSVGLLEGLLPEFGRQFENAALGPIGQENQNVPQVSPGLDSVQIAGSNERDGNGIPLGTVVIADEEPVFPFMLSST
jgi:hypothetical protein